MELHDMLSEDDWAVLQPHINFARPVGSRTIEGGWSENSDYDFLILSNKPIPSLLEDIGFNIDSHSKHYEPSEGHFNSWRRGNINLIVSYSADFANFFTAANNAARALKLTCRDDRVTLFQAVLYGRITTPKERSALSTRTGEEG